MTIIKPDTNLNTATKNVRIHEQRDHVRKPRNDLIAVEEPLEIRVVTQEDGLRMAHNIAITMRTPGHDAELALGFLLSEGVISDLDPVEGAAYAKDEDGEDLCNRVDVTLRQGTPFDVARFSRHVYTSSSCGICGKITIDRIRSQGMSAPETSIRPEVAVYLSLPQKLRTHQKVFEATGGLHGAALFSRDGGLIAVREDVGRHNAMDKLAGFMLRHGPFPGADHILMLSGRASFELLQKAISAGIPHVAAVGAPSSLAVDLAREFGVSLVGFLRDRRFNDYTAEGGPAFQ